MFLGQEFNTEFVGTGPAVVELWIVRGVSMFLATSRRFLRGFSAEGKAKTSLIAWRKLHLPKENGGLGWSGLQLRMSSQLAAKALRRLKQKEGQTNWHR
ncbi:hypothetical protein R1sor_000089 [Riccia sorocarpa]|uniref:Uncharacterized protein n=1 Tax=Riccia sorocarpa TaxID=122646 RepID=A0ABD3GS40_9MARC